VEEGVYFGCVTGEGSVAESEVGGGEDWLDEGPADGVACFFEEGCVG